MDISVLNPNYEEQLGAGQLNSLAAVQMAMDFTCHPSGNGNGNGGNKENPSNNGKNGIGSPDITSDESINGNKSPENINSIKLSFLNEGEREDFEALLYSNPKEYIVNQNGTLQKLFMCDYPMQKDQSYKSVSSKTMKALRSNFQAHDFISYILNKGVQLFGEKKLTYK